jgi:hypothetical protein
MTIEIVLRLHRNIFSQVRNGFGSDVVRNRSNSTKECLKVLYFMNILTDIIEIEIVRLVYLNNIL